VNEHDIEKGTQGRSVSVEAWGKDMPALEMAALDAARGFFGPETRLTVIADYNARCYPSYEENRRYHASVTVREVTQ
jgi:hypothetical protein